MRRLGQPDSRAADGSSDRGQSLQQDSIGLAGMTECPTRRGTNDPALSRRATRNRRGLSTTPTIRCGINEGKFDIRLDHNFSSKDSIFARFSYDQASLCPRRIAGIRRDRRIRQHPGHYQSRAQRCGFGTTFSPPGHINQFTAGFNRIFNHILSFGTGSCEAANRNSGRGPGQCSAIPSPVIPRV